MDKNKYRIIKISQDALCEFICESIIDNSGDFFDVSDVTEITSHHYVDFKNGNYICLVKSINDDETAKALELSAEIDLQKLLNNMEDTTDSLYQPNRYKEFSLDEIKALQSKI
jgi:hypothetical protein